MLLIQTADFGPKTALKIVDRVRDTIKAGKVKTASDLRTQLKSSIVDLLNGRGKSSELSLTGQLSVVFIVGVNGAGKTTTIGKLAAKFGNEGARVFLIPGDTFRAAAAEQLAEWGRRSGAVMGSFKEGSRPMAVITDCLKDAKSRQGDAAVDLVICDTAGRLHTAYALMEELQACKEAIGKVLPGMLTLIYDALLFFLSGRDLTHRQTLQVSLTRLSLSLTARLASTCSIRLRNSTNRSR